MAELIRFQRRGLLMVISAPSGCGKSSVLQGLLQGAPELMYSISVTTRPPRQGEVDGRDYHFVTRKRFAQLIGEGAFYEWAEVHGHLYGTRADTVEAALAEGRDVIMDVDVQGALAIKRRAADAVLVFLLPPTFETLDQRLRGRSLDSDEQIHLRLANARGEMRYWDQYDYALINDELDMAVTAVRGILESERLRAARLNLLNVSA